MKKKSTGIKIVFIIGGILLAWIILYGIASAFDNQKNSHKDKIAIIPVSGPISIGGASGFLETSGASSTKILKTLEKAENDGSIKAIVLEINSPGGTVVASEEIANKVKTINIPVVAWIREIGTSGAYWIASSSDSIIADPLSITGSIGVIGSYLEFSELFEKYGIGYEQLTTGEYKDIGTPFRQLTLNEKQLMLNKLNIIHEAFVDEIAANRNLPREKASELASGIFYIGKEAKDLGLVDKLGGKDLAVDTAKEMAGLDDAEIIRFEEKKSLFDVLGQLSSYPAYYIGRGIGFEISEGFSQKGFEISAI